VRRLTCDARLVAMIETEQGEVLDVGRKTRSIPCDAADPASKGVSNVSAETQRWWAT
jgi:hypothetical protein